jgi:hypothetical protein
VSRARDVVEVVARALAARPDAVGVSETERRGQTKGKPAPERVEFLAGGAKQWGLSGLRVPEGSDCNFFIHGRQFFITFLDGKGAAMEQPQLIPGAPQLVEPGHLFGSGDTCMNLLERQEWLDLADAFVHDGTEPLTGLPKALDLERANQRAGQHLGEVENQAIR